MHHIGKIFTCFLIILCISGCTASPNDSANADSEIPQGSASMQSPDAQIPAAGTETVVAKDNDWSVSSGVSKTDSDQNIEGVAALSVINTEDYSAQALIRIPLPSGITASQISKSVLRLKSMEDADVQAQLVASVVEIPWDRLSVTWDALDGHVSSPSGVGYMEDGWYCIDITSAVKGWVSGETGQYGLLIEDTQLGNENRFYSTYSSEIPENSPEIVITYTNTQNPAVVSAYSYEQADDGNCFSFALKDKNAIMGTDLLVDMDTVKTLYFGKNLDAVADYIKELSLAYIDRHADSLKISQIREITAFDSAIDADQEYRIALRVGLTERIDDSIAFDFHWQVQLEDGSWAEKLGPQPSRIVPGSNAGLAPDLYPWDQNEMWGFQDWTAFYTSKTFYFAVTKDSSAFTTHHTE